MAKKVRRIGSRCGEKVCFHGAFVKKARAEAKKAATKGARIVSTFLGGKASSHRYLVVTPKK